MNIKEKFWVGTFISLWVLVSTVSTIHSVAFFNLSNNEILSWCLAIAFEIGAMASLGGILISKRNRTLIWGLFVVLTLFQIHGNMYWAWINAGDITQWTNLFDLQGEDPNFTKRIFSFISGGILPLISLGFIKSLMDYMEPKKEIESDIQESEKENVNIDEIVNETIENTEKENSKSHDHIVKTSEIDPLIPEKELETNEFIDNINENESPKEILNKNINSSKLGNIIDESENTVNSIGEK